MTPKLDALKPAAPKTTPTRRTTVLKPQVPRGPRAPKATAGKTPASRPNRKLLASYLAWFVVLIGFVSLTLTLNLTYASRVLPNIFVNKTDVSGLHYAELNTLLDKQSKERNTVTINVGTEKVTASKDELGVSYNTAAVVKQAYGFGHTGSSLNQIIDDLSSVFRVHNLTVQPKIDQAKLDAYVQTSIASKVKTPADARLEIQHGQVVIINSTSGLQIDLDQLKVDLKKAVAFTNTKPEVTAKISVVDPKVKETDLLTYKTQIENYAKTPVSISTPDQTLIPSLAQKVTWFSLQSENDQFQIILDQSAVAGTVKILAKSYDQSPVKEQVSTTGGVIAAGRDGRTLDQTKAVNEIVAQLNSVLAGQGAAVAVIAAVSMTPKETVVLASVDAGVVPAIDTDAKFIQINLATQKMYLFENRNLINIFGISSGKRGYETPKGVHKIYSKGLRPYSSEYGLYLPYWNAITADGKYGIHDLPEWPGGKKEGENHIGIPVSHGCIRLATANAIYLYTWAPIGTAVVVQ